MSFADNYFNYFTEIEERFQQRRGSLLLLSTLDWALIETWREAGIPLDAVLRGIDAAFDRYDARKNKGRLRRVNGLAYCAQEVIAAAEEMKEAALGASPSPAKTADAGFEPERIAAHLAHCAQRIRQSPQAAQAAGLAGRLEELKEQVRTGTPSLEELERTLTVMEEKLFAILVASTPEDALLALREQAARELAPYRSRMQVVQIRQIERQFLHKRLLEENGLPRFSLFYMSQT